MARAQAAILGAWLFGSVAISLPAIAQNVPLPTPAPFPKTGAAPSTEPGRPPAPVPLQPGGTQPAPQSASKFPFPQLFNPFKPGETTAFDAKQRALVERVSA